MATLDARDPFAPRLAFAGLAPFYRRMEPVAYAALRVWFAATLFTHGYPKLMNLPHGTSPPSFDLLVMVIGGKLQLPMAVPLAMLITAIETFGAIMLALGLGTRVIAAMTAIEILVAALGVHWPSWVWTDGGMEYPLLMSAVAGYIAFRGGDRYSLDRRLGVEI